MGKNTRKGKHTRIDKKANLFPIVRHFVQAAELIFGGGKGEDKRAWVVDQINAAIDLPFLTEKDEAKAIGLIVDLVVAALNRAGKLGSAETRRARQLKRAAERAKAVGASIKKPAA